MRTAPALQVALTRFGIWRAAVSVLTLLGMLTVTGWLTGQEGLGAAAKGAAMAVVAALLWGIGLSLMRLPARRLAWDGQCWTLGEMGAGGTASVTGDISVAIDLGPWMLLRFRPGAALAWWQSMQSTWLPVQRRGIEPQWHALRCAVYSPRAADMAAAADGPAPR